MVKNRITIIGIDCFVHKNHYQSNYLATLGYSLDVFTTQANNEYTKTASVVVLPPQTVFRLLMLARYFLSHKSLIHHVEAYSGSRLGALSVLLARLLGLRVLLVERGSLYRYLHKKNNQVSRLSMYLEYQLAHMVWYKELYMEDALRKITSREIFLLPNAVPLPDPPQASLEHRDIHFLWVNSLKPFRNPTRFAQAILNLEMCHTFRAAMVGILENALFTEGLEHQVRELLSHSISINLVPWRDPFSFYTRARFFILPADIVFCNYALLEAMSYGVVPIVSDVSGTELLVRNNENGLVVPNTDAGLLQGMQNALEMDSLTWNRLSQAARRTIEEEFSISAWGNRLLASYAQLEKS